jgi:hypothetical protein
MTSSFVYPASARGGEAAEGLDRPAGRARADARCGKWPTNVHGSDVCVRSERPVVCVCVDGWLAWLCLCHLPSLVEKSPEARPPREERETRRQGAPNRERSTVNSALLGRCGEARAFAGQDEQRAQGKESTRLETCQGGAKASQQRRRPLTLLSVFR